MLSGGSNSPDYSPIVGPVFIAWYELHGGATVQGPCQLGCYAAARGTPCGTRGAGTEKASAVHDCPPAWPSVHNANAPQTFNKLTDLYRSASSRGPDIIRAVPLSIEERRQRARERRLARYGLTSEDYDALLRAQDGRCAICHQRPVRVALNVDHDHALERQAGARASVRGLLCWMCNRWLLKGARDNPESCENAAKYLREPPARPLLDA
jgi:hypothetical protein